MLSRPFGWPRLAVVEAVIFISLAAAVVRADAQTNTVSAISASSCITSAHPCATVPVQISRTDATALFAFSVTFSLSSELSLCSPGPAVTEGSYLSASGPTAFQVRDLGGGTYVADGTILGVSNCGSTDSSGTLFNIQVSNSGGSGNGTVSISSVTLRDCLNGTIASSIGSDAGVTIDLNPVAVDPISAQSVAETVLLTVTPNVTVSSCASGPVSWTATGLPTDASIDPGTGVVTWTPDCNAYENGPDYGPVTVTAHAAGGETGSASFSIQVTDNPGAVTVTLTDPPSVEELSALMMAAPSAALAGCASGTVTWSVSPALPSGATLNTSSGEVSWTPGCGQAGSYGPFTLKATAATGEFGTASLTLTVTHRVGTVDVASISDQAGGETHLLTVTPSASLTDCAAGPLTWSATGLPTDASIDPGTGVVSWTPDCAAAEVNGGLYGPVVIVATAASGETDSASFHIQVSDTPVPAPVTALSPSTVASGNGSSDRTAIQVQFTPPAGATSIEVYRAPFGNGPEYDDGPNAGSVPTAPAYPPGAPWALTGVTASGQSDLPLSRDYWYYVAFAKNACGEVSSASAVSSGALDYHLGDVSDGITVGTGDNLVNTADISVLGAHYGLTGGAMLPYDYLDVGPTTTNWIDGRPITDDAIDFEDLVIFALNYGEVSAPDRLHEPVAGAVSGSDELSLAAPSQVSPGDVVTARLTLHGAGDLSALSTQLSWDPSVVAPVSSAAGDWLLTQGGVALSAKPGTVDVAGLRARALAGDGLLATVSFRVLAAGNPGIQVLRADGRDLKNQKIAVTIEATPAADALPTLTQITAAIPNPSDAQTALAFSLAQGGPVDLSVYTVGGRRVKTLVHETREAGNYRVVWSGLDDTGKRAGAGVYYLRLVAPQGQFTRTLTLLK